MPDTEYCGKFKYDPSYDPDKHLADHIKDVKAILNQQLACIDNIKQPTMQLICMFALLDSLAQESCNYSKGSNAAFCDFVKKYQTRCKYISRVEPISLYYHVEDLIDKVSPSLWLPPEKEILLDYFSLSDIIPAEPIILSDKAQEILNYIEKKEGSDYRKKKEREHSFISLIYRMRSKAVHEMSGLGRPLGFEDHRAQTEPYYLDTDRIYVANGNVVRDHVFELVIPNVFIRGILEDCITGYLEDCQSQHRHPFSNDGITRKCWLSWYDK